MESVSSSIAPAAYVSIQIINSSNSHAHVYCPLSVKIQSNSFNRFRGT